MPGMVLDNMIANNHLESTLRDQVSDTLMYRHRHQNEKRIHHKEEGRIHLPFVRSLADIGKKCSEPKNMTFQGVWLPEDVDIVVLFWFDESVMFYK